MFLIPNPTLDQEPQQETSHFARFTAQTLSKAQHTGSWAEGSSSKIVLRTREEPSQPRYTHLNACVYTHTWGTATPALQAWNASLGSCSLFF